MKKSHKEKYVCITDDSFHDEIISCIYLNNPEIDVIEYTTGKSGKKLAQILFFEGTIQEQLQDGLILDVEVGCQYFVNLNTMRREIHRVILNMSYCRPILLSHISYTQRMFQRKDADIVNVIVETEKKTFAAYYETNGIGRLRDYILEVNVDHVSTHLEEVDEPLMKIAVETLSIEQRIALRDELLCKLNRESYKNNSIKVKYVKSGTSSARIEMNWFR